MGPEQTKIEPLLGFYGVSDRETGIYRGEGIIHLFVVVTGE